MKWLAMDIGCLECGENSFVIGVFSTEEEATEACKPFEEFGWRGGQHYYQVFDLDEFITMEDVSNGRR